MRIVTVQKVMELLKDAGTVYAFDYAAERDGFFRAAWSVFVAKSILRHRARNGLSGRLATYRPF